MHTECSHWCFSKELSGDCSLLSSDCVHIDDLSDNKHLFLCTGFSLQLNGVSNCDFRSYGPFFCLSGNLFASVVLTF